MASSRSPSSELTTAMVWQPMPTPWAPAVREMGARWETNGVGGERREKTRDTMDGTGFKAVLLKSEEGMRNGLKESWGEGGLRAKAEGIVGQALGRLASSCREG